ncbi:MAG: iron-sulfur cluster assembly protein, partial [Sandaracinaceae bacterium]
LKVNKITRTQGGKVGLSVYGQPEAYAGPTEAFGGDGVAPEPVEEAELRERIVLALKEICDPEIPVNIYDLGLIYGFTIDDEANVEIEMTLTAPACPVAGMLVTQVAREVGNVRGVRTSHVKLTWDPPWTKARMSEEALLELGLL